jgi:NADH:ubiquinone oxidoreductase subunit 5 (subunit L)/multisubunit Na+/H+ antiporter MnhA subunit
MVVNRIGDVGIALAIFTGFYLFKSVDFNVMFSMIEQVQNDYFVFFTFPVHTLTLFAIFLLIAAVGKSAQLGLHT